MTLFIVTDNEDQKFKINEKLRYLWDHQGCLYTKTYEDGTTAKVLWRCSLKRPTEKTSGVEAVDWWTMVMGYSMNYLPKNFFHTYGASAGMEDLVLPTS